MWERGKEQGWREKGAHDTEKETERQRERERERGGGWVLFIWHSHLGEHLAMTAGNDIRGC